MCALAEKSAANARAVHCAGDGPYISAQSFLVTQGSVGACASAGRSSTPAHLRVWSSADFRSARFLPPRMEFCGVMVVKDVIQYHIMALLHPSDFVRLRQTCRTLRRIGSGKRVLRAAGARLYAILDRKTAYNMRKLAAKKAGSGPVSADELVLVAFQKGELCKASLLLYERATMRAVFATLTHVPELCAGKLTLTQNEDGFQVFRMVYENGELQELASRSEWLSVVSFSLLTLQK
jgi:hypothetical protein